jgi:hypothetical protein
MDPKQTTLLEQRLLDKLNGKGESITKHTLVPIGTAVAVIGVVLLAAYDVGRHMESIYQSISYATEQRKLLDDRISTALKRLESNSEMMRQIRDETVGHNEVKWDRRQMHQYTIELQKIGKIDVPLVWDSKFNGN